MASTPISAATSDRDAGAFRDPSAVAGGPISSAVLRTAPIVTRGERHGERQRGEVDGADGPTRTPRAAASSGLSELRSSLR